MDGTTGRAGSCCPTRRATSSASCAPESSEPAPGCLEVPPRRGEPEPGRAELWRGAVRRLATIAIMATGAEIRHGAAECPENGLDRHRLIVEGAKDFTPGTDTRGP